MLNVECDKREDNVIINYKDGRFYYFIICRFLLSPYLSLLADSYTGTYRYSLEDFIKRKSAEEER
jgi:hypothetical protein